MASEADCITLPNTTCPMSPLARPERSIAPCAATTPRSVGLRFLSDPPNAPKPVRTPLRKTTMEPQAGAVPASDTSWPQLAQNRQPGSRSAPQESQGMRVTERPQLGQKLTARLVGSLA